jgi:hypothetical protein
MSSSAAASVSIFLPNTRWRYWKSDNEERTCEGKFVQARTTASIATFDHCYPKLSF